MNSLAYQTTNDRRHTRTSLSVDVSLESDSNFFTGLTENISEGGLFVATHSLREIGAMIEFELTLPGSEAPIRATGVVRWVRLYSESSDSPPGLGIQFIDMPQADIDRIREFVKTREPLFWD
jgi:uncharacterized protein (TIGR02266 family)